MSTNLSRKEFRNLIMSNLSSLNANELYNLIIHCVFYQNICNKSKLNAELSKRSEKARRTENSQRKRQSVFRQNQINQINHVNNRKSPRKGNSSKKV